MKTFCFQIAKALQQDAFYGVLRIFSLLISKLVESDICHVSLILSSYLCSGKATPPPSNTAIKISS